MSLDFTKLFQSRTMCLAKQTNRSTHNVWLELVFSLCMFQAGLSEKSLKIASSIIIFAKLCGRRGTEQELLAL